jgi:hypothetical protein
MLIHLSEKRASRTVDRPKIPMYEKATYRPSDEKRVFEVLKSYVGYPTRAIVEAMQALPTLFALGGNK